jgi:hypothetical protein
MSLTAVMLEHAAKPPAAGSLTRTPAERNTDGEHHVDRLQTDKHKVGSLDEHIANLPSSEIPRRGLQRADVILIYLQGRIIIAIQRAFVSGSRPSPEPRIYLGRHWPSCLDLRDCDGDRVLPFLFRCGGYNVRT